jgi:hypothetical protein
MQSSPLTDEELALVRALEEHSTTAAVSEGGEGPGVAIVDAEHLAVELQKQRVREALGRTIAEAIEPMPVPFEAQRRFVPGDSALLRGQTGHRVVLSIDGVPLRSALSDSRETSGWFTIDPWLIERARIDRPSAIDASPGATAGSIALAGLSPAVGSGVDAEAEVEARSADRSTATHVAVGASSGWAALKVAGGYSDAKPLRAATSSTGREVGSGHQRENISTRLRLLGRKDDPLLIYAGADFERLLNATRTDLAFGTSPAPIDRVDERFLLFASTELGNDTIGAVLLGSRQSFSRTIDQTGLSEARRSESAVTYFGKAQLHLTIIDELTLYAGAIVEISDAGPPAGFSSVQTSGETRNITGFTSLRLQLAVFDVRAGISVVDLRTALDDGTSPIDGTFVLSQGSARARIWGPVALLAGWTQGAYVPTIRDLSIAAGPLQPETSVSFDFGPSLRIEDAFLDLLAFYTRISNAIEPQGLTAPSLINIADVEVVGLELMGGWRIIDRLHAGLAATWSEGKDRSNDASIGAFPALTAKASLRYDLPVRSAFIEAHLRATTKPFALIASHVPDATLDAPPRVPTSFVRAGLMGGADLGMGFGLRVSIENAFDAAYRTPTSLVPGAGIDVRASLSYTWR